MIVFTQGWWAQEWHVWTGLALSSLGLLVGYLSWLNAKRAKGEAGAAKESARNVSSSLENFKEDLREELDQRRALVATEPVVPEPANFGYVPLRIGQIRFTNLGPGIAYDVRVSAANNATTVSGTTRARKLQPEAYLECAVSYDNGMDLYATVRVTWILHNGAQPETQTIQIREAIPLLG